ncbi:MAG TPA: hypothetical protein DCM02_03105, partial [Flavobacterium sp.]|nr:hypothetical protein [Flavobacterium sp.]
MMNIAIKNKNIEKYFSFLYKLDNFSKKRLIIKLTESIEAKEKEKIDLKSLFGSWDDTRSSDEIISEIKKSRIEKN